MTLVLNQFLWDNIKAIEHWPLADSWVFKEGKSHLVFN